MRWIRTFGRDSDLEQALGQLRRSPLAGTTEAAANRSKEHGHFGGPPGLGCRRSFVPLFDGEAPVDLVKSGSMSLTALREPALLVAESIGSW